MAFCEHCGTSGFKPQDMSSDSSLRILIGPCCSQKMKISEFDIGVEISYQKGIQAYMKYGDYSLKFQKAPHERQDSSDIFGSRGRDPREIERLRDLSSGQKVD